MLNIFFELLSFVYMDVTDTYLGHTEDLVRLDQK